MAKPSYDEVIEQRNAAREEVEALKKQIEGLTTPSENPFQWSEALERVRVLEDENAELSEKLELLRLNPIGAQLANDLNPDGITWVNVPIHEIPDDDPADPRPEMHPALGWADPAVTAWAERRKAKAEPETVSE